MPILIHVFTYTSEFLGYVFYIWNGEERSIVIFFVEIFFIPLFYSRDAKLFNTIVDSRKNKFKRITVIDQNIYGVF